MLIIRIIRIINGINQITHDILSVCIEVHKVLEPGLLESVYQKCLVVEPKPMGYDTPVEVSVPVVYKGYDISEDAYRLDILVNDTVIN